MKTNVVLATTNAHKVKEISAVWGEVPFAVQTLRDFPPFPEVVEDGKTFAENAIKKAVESAKILNAVCVADDSGLEVDALQGRPGIFSARYAGKGATDFQNLEKVLKEMEGVSDFSLRTARFRCAAACATPEGLVEIVEGAVEGVLLTEPKGRDGFGYDPIFFVPALQKTFSEVPLEVKNQLSHRAQAFRKMKEVLLQQFRLK